MLKEVLNHDMQEHDGKTVQDWGVSLPNHVVSFHVFLASYCLLNIQTLVSRTFSVESRMPGCRLNQDLGLYSPTILQNNLSLFCLSLKVTQFLITVTTPIRTVNKKPIFTFKSRIYGKIRIMFLKMVVEHGALSIGQR